MAKIKGCSAHGSPGAFTTVGVKDLEIEDCIAYNSEGAFASMTDDAYRMKLRAKIIQDIGLPHDIDSKELAELIKLVRETPENEKDEVLKKSSFLRRFLDNTSELAKLIKNIKVIAMLPSAPFIVKVLEWAYKE